MRRVEDRDLRYGTVVIGGTKTGPAYRRMLVVRETRHVMLSVWISINLDRDAAGTLAGEMTKTVLSGSHTWMTENGA